MKDKRIQYTSENGYMGILYGKSSMSIYYPDGKEAIHTGNRTPQTLSELMHVVDEMPDFMEMLARLGNVHDL